MFESLQVSRGDWVRPLCYCEVHTANVTTWWERFYISGWHLKNYEYHRYIFFSEQAFGAHRVKVEHHKYRRVEYQSYIIMIVSM